ncbi:hypothetical protein MNBD_UNCLBAC01-1434 [hydrothermal vent metagenome]|uniref:Uncharacterized protein n=1 Tax=hydrothermal vent metagenome TaxID=652676 RepID=A0A3B1D019_9ZZZZ
MRNANQLKQQCSIFIFLFFFCGYSTIGIGHATENPKVDEWKDSHVYVDAPLEANTDGPLWPPSEVMDENGDFVVIGSILEIPDGQGNFFPGPKRAVIVSKNVVPPLDVNGKEDFSNLFGAPQPILRELDLSRNSIDLDMVLYSLSYGPVVGDFGGGPRIPMEGESDYNLNPFPPACPEIFPTSSQEDYRRPSYPLHEVPIWGFQGDQFLIDAETGELVSNPELPLDQRPRIEPITLRDWLKAGRRSRVSVELIDYDEEKEAYTAANFEFRLKKLLPNSVYTIWAIRLVNMIPPAPGQSLSIPDPLCFPSVITTNKKGRARFECKVENPFPSQQGPDAIKRIMTVALSYQSSHQSWGACPSRFAEGVDNHLHLSVPTEHFEALETESK